MDRFQQQHRQQLRRQQHQQQHIQEEEERVRPGRRCRVAQVCSIRRCMTNSAQLMLLLLVSVCTAVFSIGATAQAAAAEETSTVAIQTGICGSNLVENGRSLTLLSSSSSSSSSSSQQTDNGDNTQVAASSAAPLVSLHWRFTTEGQLIGAMQYQGEAWISVGMGKSVVAAAAAADTTDTTVMAVIGNPSSSSNTDNPPVLYDITKHLTSAAAATAVAPYTAEADGSIVVVQPEKVMLSEDEEQQHSSILRNASITSLVSADSTTTTVLRFELAESYMAKEGSLVMIYYAVGESTDVNSPHVYTGSVIVNLHSCQNDPTGVGVSTLSTTTTTTTSSTAEDTNLITTPVESPGEATTTTTSAVGVVDAVTVCNSSHVLEGGQLASLTSDHVLVLEWRWILQQDSQENPQESPQLEVALQYQYDSASAFPAGWIGLGFAPILSSSSTDETVETIAAAAVQNMTGAMGVIGRLSNNTERPEDSAVQMYSLENHAVLLGGKPNALATEYQDAAFTARSLTVNDSEGTMTLQFQVQPSAAVITTTTTTGAGEYPWSMLSSPENANNNVLVYYAVGAPTGMGHLVTGVLRLNLNACNNPSAEEDATTAQDTATTTTDTTTANVNKTRFSLTFWILHGTLGALAVLVCFPTAFTASWFPQFFPTTWIYIHVGAMSSALLLLCFTTLLALVGSNRGVAGSSRSSTVHLAAGCILTLLMMFQVGKGIRRPPVSPAVAKEPILQQNLEEVLCADDRGIDHATGLIFTHEPSYETVFYRLLDWMWNAFVVPPMMRNADIHNSNNSKRERWHWMHRWTAWIILILGVHQVCSGINLLFSAAAAAADSQVDRNNHLSRKHRIVNICLWLYMVSVAVVWIGIKVNVIRREWLHRREQRVQEQEEQMMEEEQFINSTAAAYGVDKGPTTQTQVTHHQLDEFVPGGPKQRVQQSRKHNTSRACRRDSNGPHTTIPLNDDDEEVNEDDDDFEYGEKHDYSESEASESYYDEDDPLNIKCVSRSNSSPLQAWTIREDYDNNHHFVRKKESLRRSDFKTKRPDKEDTTSHFEV